jgi:hypothetical protein
MVRAALAVVLIAGCVGSVGDMDDETAAPGAAEGRPDTAPGTAVGGASTGVGGGAAPAPAAASTAFACTPGAAGPSPGWKKLTTAQYRNTLRDLLGFALKDRTAAAAVMNAIAGALARLPEDERPVTADDPHGSYRRLDQDLSQIHVDAAYDVALAVGAALTTRERLGAVVGACATDSDASNDDACITAFIQRFGERALRRPLTTDEVAFYRVFYGPGTAIDAAGFGDLIGGLLNAPQFLYQVEHADEAVAGRPGAFALSAYELAARLSYQFWDTMPDDGLWAAARSGALKAPAGWAAELARVFADPRTRATVDDFYRDYLKLDDLPLLDTRLGDPVFKAFAADDLPKATLRGSVIDDALAMTRYHTWDRAGGSYDDLLTSNLSFAKGADLARIYGVAPWAAGEPPAFAPDARPGLLTRAAFLMSGSANTRPIMKGVFVRKTLLCDEIPPPPSNVNAVPPELSPKLTTRQVVEALTETPGTACAGCHATLINPIGYATEGFDALGRVRVAQRLFSDEGVELARMPVDTRSVPRIAAGDATPSSGPADLARLVAASGKAQACFARNYVRFTFARAEDLGADGCVLERLRQAAGKAGSLRAMLKEIAMTPEFQQRTMR